MPDSTTYDTLIVGYGPVGATMAALLARHGLTVAVVEQAAGIYDKPRAITLDHEVMRIFQACGLADEIAPFTAPHPGTHYLGVEHDVIRIYDPQPPPHLLGWPPSGTFVQPEVEAVLRAGAARSGQADVFLATQAVAFTAHAGQAERSAPLRRAVSSAATAPTASCAGSSASATRTSPSTNGGWWSTC